MNVADNSVHMVHMISATNFLYHLLTLNNWQKPLDTDFFIYFYLLLDAIKKSYMASSSVLLDLTLIDLEGQNQN